MASVAEAPATQQQYLAQVAITAALVTALAHLRQIDPDPTSQAFRAGVHALVEQFSAASASVARDFYSESRTAAGITAPIRVAPVAPPSASKIDSGLAWANRAAVTTSSPDFQAAVQQRLDAATQKIVADTAREQVLTAVAGDELAIGFRRVPRPDACAFCILMATRSTKRAGLGSDWMSSGGRAKSERGRPLPGYGSQEHFGIYKSRTTASGAATLHDFEGDGPAKFHNNCHCVVEPVFSPVEQLPGWLEDMRQLYNQTDDGLNGFRRAIYAQRNGTGGPTSPIAPVVPLRAMSTQPQLAALLGSLDDFMRRGVA